MTNETKHALAFGAVAFTFLALFLLHKKTVGIAGSLSDTSTTPQTAAIYGPSNAVDPNLRSTYPTVSAMSAGDSLPTCGCTGNQTFYVDNSALSKALNDKYMGYANNYYDSIVSAMPQWVTQYFNNTAHTTGLSAF